MAYRHVSGLVVLLFACLCGMATTARAQIHAACCLCGDFYELEPQGAGFARNHIDFCPKCIAKYGTMDQALQRLRGRLKGLKEAADLALRELREGLAERDKARDAIYGTRGSAVKFFRSLASLASQGTGSAIKTVAKNLGKTITWYNRGQAVAAGDFKPLADAAQGMLTGKAKDALKDKVGLKAAAAAGRQHYQQTGDARGATKAFLDRRADIKSGFALAEAVKGFYDSTDNLANGIQDYLDAREKVNRAQKDWEDATDQMMEVIEIIEKVEHCKRLAAKRAGKAGADARRSRLGLERLALPVPSLIAVLQTIGPLTASASASTPAPPPTTAPATLSFQTTATERAALMAQRDEIRKAVGADPGPSDEQLRQFLKKLPDIRSAARALAERADEAWPPVAPLALDLHAELGPELTRALVELAAPAWTELAQRYDALMALVNGLSVPGLGDAVIHVTDEGADAAPAPAPRSFVPSL